MNRNDTATLPVTGVGGTLAVMAVTAQDDVLDMVRAALEGQDEPVDLLHCRDTAQLGCEGLVSGLAMIVLQCSGDAERARRDLELVYSLAGTAPIVVLGDHDAGVSYDDAMTAGAWDVITGSDTIELRVRLRQALELGRTRVELLDAAQRLNQTQRQLDVLLSHGEDARATLVGQHVTDPNAAFARLIGVAGVDDASQLDLLERVAPHDRDRVTKALEQVAADQSDTALEFELTTHLNHRESVRALLSPGVAENPDDKRTAIVLQSLTGGHDNGGPARAPALDGRMALHEVLAQHTGRAGEEIAGMIFVGVDEASALQQRLGLAASDRLLQEVGLYLLEAIRGEDRVFRFGAGEYVLLVERHAASEIDEFAQALHAKLCDEVFGDGSHGVSLASSLTWCVLSGSSSDNGAPLEALLDGVHALRREGGNAYRKCTPESAPETRRGEHEAWAERLREALTQNRFSLAYQGVTSLAGDSQPYFDVLLRYIDDRGALVRPGEFLPAAEQSRIMPSIDRWVVQRAIDVVWQQQARDAHIALFVKLSSETIEDADTFVNWLETAIEARPIPRSHLIFSLREADVRNHARSAQRLAEALVKSDFRLALTHYGSTPKAIQVLDRMPVDFIKLAPDFARQILDRDEDERLTRIIASARDRNIPLIAEQIEDANSMARLWQAGVNYVQGHFIQEPDTQALTGSDNSAV